MKIKKVIIKSVLIMLMTAFCFGYHKRETEKDIDNHMSLIKESETKKNSKTAEELEAKRIKTEIASNQGISETKSIDENDDLLDNVDEDDIKYKIFSNELITNFVSEKELAKTGDPEIDGFLQRFYEKVLHGDNYIQFFLDTAEGYGVNTDIVDELIDINSNQNVDIWFTDIQNHLKEDKTTEDNNLDKLH